MPHRAGYRRRVSPTPCDELMAGGGPELIVPTSPSVGIVATIPHGGRSVPPPFDTAMAVEPITLWSDWFTRELYEFLPRFGVTVVRTSLSRFVADPNRDPTTGHGRFWNSVVPASDWEGMALYRRPLTRVEVADRVAAAHTPFHRLLDHAIEAVLAQHGRVLVLDLHSFGMDLDVDVDLGNQRGGSASAEVTGAVGSAFESHGFKVGYNHRFPGGWTVGRVGRMSGVDAVQVELNQRRYLNPVQAGDPARVPDQGGDNFADAAHRLECVIADVTRPWRTLHPTSVRRRAEAPDDSRGGACRPR
ncbi:MAG: N-formylglutamate amidohydrolase [Candidatus Microthrix parvicella]|nr:N-formylglutamate amidohydrolase [Candidatus Microthrix parvicella]NLH66684.1 N-formylglutamate amidohydrolase [Candidatus Microthrix parvicella]